LDVVILLVFVSLVLVAAGLVFFVHRLRDGDFDHGERLSLAPLDDDGPQVSGPPQGESRPESPVVFGSDHELEGGPPHVSR